MCGICFIFKAIHSCDFQKDVVTFLNKSSVHHRGPDATQTLTKCLNQKGSMSAFIGFTLHFQGEVTAQPLSDEEANILLWNGEVFGGVETNNRNDGLVILNDLKNCEEVEDILSLFANVFGPWAFIYWQEKKKTIWFGRDVFGRRSLLFHRSSDGSCFALSSVTSKAMEPWKEVPATGIYCIKFSSEQNVSNITHYPYVTSNSTKSYVQKMEEGVTLFHNTVDTAHNIWECHISQGGFGISIPFSNFNTSITNDQLHQNVDVTADEITSDSIQKFATEKQMYLRNKLIDVLAEAVKVRVKRQSHLCHNCITSCLQADKLSREEQLHTLHTRNPTDIAQLSLNNDVNFSTHKQESNQVSDTQVKSTNVSTNSRVQPNAVTGEDQSICDTNTCNSGDYVNRDGKLTLPTKESVNNEICSDICHINNKFDIEILLDSDKNCGHSRIAVLFSGGIDSLVIAALADRYVPEDEPIDLLNVAFEQLQKEDSCKKKKKASFENKYGSESVKSHFNVPDRITGIDGLQQLRKDRKWNFVEINVTLEQLQKAREKHVKDLVYPLNTVLDDSIGCAIWFAARGQGIIKKGEDYVPYTTTARVVLVGMGADEQLIGYSRHRVKYKTEGMEGLIAEIKMEIERISARNLGRDDRIISDHSKEARFPFLDEHVVSFLNELPLGQKANLNLPRGIGEKFLLRLAAVKLGLGESSILPKRAIQFGSRIAKIENRKEKASDVCERL